MARTMVRKAWSGYVGIDWCRTSRLRGEHDATGYEITRTRDAINNVEAYLSSILRC